MKVTQIEKLNQLISRTDMNGNRKVEWLTNFIDGYVTEQLRLHDVVKSLPNDEEVKSHIDALPYYGSCTTEYNEGFEDGVKWLKEQLVK